MPAGGIQREGKEMGDSEGERGEVLGDSEGEMSMRMGMESVGGVNRGS